MELKILAKNTVMLATPQVLKFAVGIIKSKFIAIFLGVTGAGIIDQLQDIITQIRGVSLSSLPDGMVKLIAQENGIEINVKKIATIIKTYMFMIIPLVLVIIILGYSFTDEITLYVFGDIKYKLYFQIGFIAFPVTILSSTSRALLKAFKEVKSFAIAEIIIIIANIIVFVPLIYYLKIFGGVIYVTISFIVTFFVVYSLMRKNVMIKYNIKFSDLKNAVFSNFYLKELLSYMGVGIIGGAFLTFTEVATRAIIVNELGIDKLGLYSPITRWASLFVGFILPSIFTYLYPRLSESRSNEDTINVLNDVIRLITFVTLPFVIIGIASREWIIPLFYSKDFLEAAIYLPYHFSALIFVIWSSILSQLFYATGRLKKYLIFGLMINGISLALVYFLVPVVGLYGYLAKFTIVPLIMLITYFIFWKHEINFRIKEENMKIIIYTLVSSMVLLFLKDRIIFLQIFAAIFIIFLYFLLKKQEKLFLINKLKGIFHKK